MKKKGTPNLKLQHFIDTLKKNPYFFGITFLGLFVVGTLFFETPIALLLAIIFIIGLGTWATYRGLIHRGVHTVMEQRALPSVVFVLGGPGVGKGTQCAKISKEFGYVHLSAGDLLRAEVKSGSPDGEMIENMIRNGQIVPSQVTINLLKKAIEQSDKSKFLVDGFPRNQENNLSWEQTMNGVVHLACLLMFECPEEVMMDRLLGRREGRVDDTMEVVKKRLVTYREQTLPVIQYYEDKQLVRRIDSNRPVDDVFEDVKILFTSLQ